ncbi:MAG: hypothetical protein WD048_15415 [Chitinophagales bacterium]
MKNLLKILSLFFILSIFIVACGKDDEDTDLCAEITCVNGECVDGDCVCEEGYTGENCEIAPANHDSDICDRDAYTFEEDSFGLAPNHNELACIVQGEDYNEVIYIKNFTVIQFQGNDIEVEYLTIDSLTNLPEGIEYEFSNSNRTFAPGEHGCISLSGLSTVAEGDYKLGVYVTVKVNVLENPISDEATSLAVNNGVDMDFTYYLRVRADGAPCDDVVE